MAVNTKHFEIAMAAALGQTGEKKKLKIERHEFNVKPAIIERGSGLIIVKGTDGHQISHRRTWVADDQITYSFGKKGDEVTDLEISIANGGFWPTFKKVWKVIEVVKDIYDTMKSEDEEKKADTWGVSRVAIKDVSDADLQRRGFHETKRLLDGTWEGEANFMIANIALRVK